MRIDSDLKLDFRDVLIRPKRSGLLSRSEVVLRRRFTFPHSGDAWEGVPLIASNMDTVGTLMMAEVLARHGMLTALHKFYSVEECRSFFGRDADSTDADGGKCQNPDIGIRDAVFFSFGITEVFMERLDAVMAMADARERRPKFVCLDVANGYSEQFITVVRAVREKYPEAVIMAGNVVTGEMTEELVIAGADIVKVGIGSGSVCTTREQTGVGFPQLSAVIECADAAHGLKGLVCSDGGCRVPGDVAKAFAAGADFVMLGGMLAGHDESGGEVSVRRYLTDELDDNGERIVDERRAVTFYGMSSDTAMQKYYGGVAEYRASEGVCVELPYRGAVEVTLQEILGGLRSTCTYVGAHRLKELSKRATFVIGRSAPD
ncbi:MAG: GMP reductase [Rhodospirillales bacterium CG15_BIG_FIL_POST_REV_8_21_14_020_66_15]|nr:MAG: GMP reductase [Rhodospirillales bacterium CG15_BIG_FIL_POST_REV_8_21_14_020_66_15]